MSDKLPDKKKATFRERELSGLRRISSALAATLDIDELLPLLMTGISDVMDCERSTLFLVDPQREDLWSRFMQGSEEVIFRVPFGKGVAGEVARTGKSMIVANAYSHPLFLAEVDRLTGFRTRSILAVPLTGVADELVGVVEVLNRRDGEPFDEEDLSLLSSFSPQISLALKTSWLYTSALRHNKELDVISEIERDICRTSNPDEALGRLLEKAIHALGCEAGSILLRQDDDKGTLYFRTALGPKSQSINGRTIPLGQGIAGWVTRTGEPARVNEVEGDDRYDPSIAEMIGFETRQVLAVPLRSPEGVIGSVEVLNRSGGAPFTAESERFLNVIGGQIVRALTQVHESFEREQRERLATIGNMLSGVVHDLRTPMTVINSYADFLAGEVDEERRKMCAGRIIHQLKVLVRMTESLLAFARGESRVYIRKVYMNSFLDELAELVGAETRGCNVVVEWQRDYEGVARFDADGIRRVLINLCRNAIEAMADGGRLGISARQEGATLELRIADTGPGIPPGILDRLFETFVTSGKKNGTGLGLAIAKQTVVDHGGTINVKTEQGKGTVFTINLPLEPEEQAASSP